MSRQSNAGPCTLRWVERIELSETPEPAADGCLWLTVYPWIKVLHYGAARMEP